MLGLKRRRRVDGWAVEVSESEPDGGSLSVRQRIGDSDKLWAAALIAIVLIAAFLYMSAKGGGEDQKQYTVQPASSPSGSYDDAAHRKFEVDVRKKISRGVGIIEARFVGLSKFRITVPGNTSADSMEYISCHAAERILHDFKTQAVVQVYMRTARGKMILAATARYDPDQYGFIVKFEK